MGSESPAARKPRSRASLEAAECHMLISQLACQHQRLFEDSDGALMVALLVGHNTQIAQQQDHINHLQTSLQAQMSAADAAIAQLEQQQSYYTSLFTAMILPSPQQLGSL